MESTTFLKMSQPYEIRNFSPREYQQRIFEASTRKNTLVCLPTGTGKTKSAILLGLHTINKSPQAKVVILSPTKPLANQICNEFRNCTTLDAERIILLTGITKSEERGQKFNDARVIVATPQTIENDVTTKRISLKDVDLLVIDECHRSKQKFANTIVAKKYNEQRPDGRILALTASPGATKEKIEEVCTNLFIENVEIRTDEDAEVMLHMQPKSVEYRKILLPPQITNMVQKVRTVYGDVGSTLSSFGLHKPAQYLNKKDLLMLQRRFQQEIARGNAGAYTAISITTKLIKLSYLTELLETQTVNAAKEYMQRLEQETSKASQSLMRDRRIDIVKREINEFVEQKKEHPKMQELKTIVEGELKERPQARVIIFANYRSTVDEIERILRTVVGVSAVKLVGQSKGFSQKDQLALIDKFNGGVYNILITTSVGEEGLSIGSLDLALFYDQTASEIRRIQRTGRVGRVKPGKIIHIIAKGTRDEAMLWTSMKKEKKMQNILQFMKRKLSSEEQKRL